MVELKDHQQQDGGQAAVSLTPDGDGIHVHISESSQLEGSYGGDLQKDTKVGSQEVGVLALPTGDPLSL